MREVVNVLCVDDRDDGETFDRHFDADRERRRELLGYEPDRLVRFGQVVTSARAAQNALVRAARDAVVPHVVLIDNMLRGARHDVEEAGLDLMLSMREELRNWEDLEAPAYVLCTARFSPGLAYAFVCCGGVQVIDKLTSWPEQIEAIWQAVDWHSRGEGCWTHAPRPGYRRISLPPACVELLPYLEADMPPARITRALGLPPRAVSDRRRDLVEAINAQVPIHQLPDQELVLTNGRSTSLAKIAQDHGHIWVPLAYATYVARSAGI